MFVRKVKNASNGKTYVQVIDKSTGRYKVIKSIGSCRSEDHKQLAKLAQQGRSWIQEYLGLQQLDFTNHKQAIQSYLQGVEHLRLAGVELLLGGIFDQIGFDQITDPIFKKLVIYRLVYPVSKLKTTEYLRRYEQLQWNEDKLYRYMDRLYNTQKQQVQRISYQHSLQVLGGQLSVVFYDVTTIYFEIDNEDELRKTGFSKEGKHQHPQIVLGLLVSQYGYPLAYEIFQGNTFEAHTMLPVIESFKQTYQLDKLVIIADSGLLSNKTITKLEESDYEFILGARLKNESKQLKERILGLDLSDGQAVVLDKDALVNLVISYSDKRAKKDRYNRQRGYDKLEKKLKSGRLTKAHINNRGYNKYLRLQGQMSITLDKEKFEADAKWDGLKGYITNTSLSKEQVIENYNHLWHIEKAFRVAKSELRLRPVYHRLECRIHAHICMAFVAYKVYKELERQLKLKNSAMSPTKAIEIAQSIFEIRITVPNSDQSVCKLLLLTQEQRHLAELFEFGC